jgi:hypothetical protein
VDVSGGIPLLTLNPPARDGGVGADDAELGAEKLRHLDRLTNRLSGSFGAIGPNHDAIEHAPSFVRS